MSLFRGLGFRKDATRGTTPIEVRKSLAGFFSATGVMPDGPSPLLTGTAGWAYTVAGPAWFVATRGPSDGVALYGNDGNVVIGTTGVGSTVPIAPGAGLSRIDIAWTRHQSAGENGDPATTVANASEPLFGVESGVAASSSPVAPVIPAGAIELGRNTMTSAATTTASAGNTITQSAPVAALRAAGVDTTQTLTNKTLTAPVIGDLTNANHVHKNAVTGGVLPYTASGSTIDTPSGVGNIAIAYGVTFTTAVYCIATTADTASVVVTCPTGTTTGATVRLFDGATGAALTTGSRRVNWSATGILA